MKIYKDFCGHTNITNMSFLLAQIVKTQIKVHFGLLWTWELLSLVWKQFFMLSQELEVAGRDV